MIREFCESWNENLDELHRQETEELRAHMAQISRLDRVVCESQEEARRELRRAGYLL